MNGATLVKSLTRPRAFTAILVVLSGIQSWSYASYGLGGSDEGALLATAGRILRGDVFYQDIDAYPFPGSNYLLALAMSLLGEHLSVARLLAALIYSGIVVTLYAIALQLLDRQRAALFGISLFGFKFLAWPAYTSYFYWDLSFLGACIAVLLLLGGSDRFSRSRLIGVGAATGIAFISKQSIGIYLGLAIVTLLILERVLNRDERTAANSMPRVVGHLMLGFALAAGPLILYFAAKGLLPQMIYSGLIRPFTDYANTSGISFTTPLRWWELGSLKGGQQFFYYPVSYWNLVNKELLPGGEGSYAFYWMAGEIFVRGVYSALPLTFAAALVSCMRNRKRFSLPEEQRFAAFALLCAAVTGSAFPRADFTHLMGVYPMVLLLMFSCVGRLASMELEGIRTRRLRRAEAAAVAFFALLFLTLGLMRHAAMTAHIDLQRADLQVFPEDSYRASVVRFVTDELPEDAPLFIYGHEAHYYFLSGRYSSWKFLQLYPGQAGGDDGRALTEMLKQNPPRVVIQGFLNFPGIPSLPSYTPILHEYLRANYERDDRAFRRYPTASGSPPSAFWIQLFRLKSDADPGRS
ncbi:MAG: glycosyltransferase family 39 protein [Deltaproteobacteria bacterium]|nr:glycosyltransferase family 39 protein [Deltaproteobacteria bacterium]MBW2724062.1 glycosyltransferase family 39 protein [Deltaproteobacteria bacterium]